jgi:hypothetical protein
MIAAPNPARWACGRFGHPALPRDLARVVLPGAGGDREGGRDRGGSNAARMLSAGRPSAVRSLRDRARFGPRMRPGPYRKRGRLC